MTDFNTSVLEEELHTCHVACMEEEIHTNSGQKTEWKRPLR